METVCPRHRRGNRQLCAVMEPRLIRGQDRRLTWNALWSDLEAIVDHCLMFNGCSFCDTIGKGHITVTSKAIGQMKLF